MNTQGKVEIEAAEHASTPTQQSYKRTCGPAERRSPSNLLRPACSRQSAWESFQKEFLSLPPYSRALFLKSSSHFFLPFCT
jgi:hypothetical protein